MNFLWIFVHLECKMYSKEEMAVDFKDRLKELRKILLNPDWIRIRSSVGDLVKPSIFDSRCPLTVATLKTVSVSFSDLNECLKMHLPSIVR